MKLISNIDPLAKVEIVEVTVVVDDNTGKLLDYFEEKVTAERALTSSYVFLTDRKILKLSYPNGMVSYYDTISVIKPSTADKQHIAKMELEARREKIKSDLKLRLLGELTTEEYDALFGDK